MLKTQDEIMREELKAYYWQGTAERAEEFRLQCESELERLYRPDMSAYEMKALQYRVIADRMDPVLFYHLPYYFETGTMWALSDGCRKAHGHQHAGGWTYYKNRHIFEDQDPELWKKRKAQEDDIFYLICGGAYNDNGQHFNFDLRPVLSAGLKDIYRRAGEALKGAKEDEERQFLGAMREGLLCWKKLGEKFAKKAGRMLDAAPDDLSRSYMERIAGTAGRVPWEKPETLYEALNTCAFMRKALGSFEGIGPNTFGRLDLELEPFYRHDVENGILTPEEAYDLIWQFLVAFDMHYDHDMKMEGYADHELENTFVLGGCDGDGKTVYNELTKMFLRAAREAKTIFPKIKCRISSDSPREYLDDIDRAVVAGTSTVLYHNDDAAIPALVREGIPLGLARDYIVTGCWSVTLQGVEKFDHGNYVNMLKPFEYSLHLLNDRMEKVGMRFAPLDGSPDFETLYRTVCDNIRILFCERAGITHRGGHVWNKVDPLPLFSSTLMDCIEKRRDLTNGGARYRDDSYLLVGFPNIVDSLLAIKTLCYDEKKYSLQELLAAVRNNWEGNALMRAEAMACPGWGDGSDESCKLANRFNNDLYDMLGEFTGTWGGKIRMGHLTYTEVRFWGEKTLATPDGRRNGEYIAQGLTPSRLKKIPAVTDVIHSLKALDATTMAGGGVINIILPSDRVDLDRCAAFLYAATKSAMPSLQLNCATREQLLDAQKHPEKYPDLIVRVTGFSAKFTSLSPEWQQEVLTRNFYE